MKNWKDYLIIILIGFIIYNCSQQKIEYLKEKRTIKHYQDSIKKDLIMIK